MNQQPRRSRPLATTQITAGMLLIGSAALAWAAGGIADDMAAIHEQSATLRPPAAGASHVSSWMAPIAAAIDPDVRTHDATARYWTGDYPALTETADSGAAETDALLVSANAAFRRAQADGRPLSPERLDPILQGYAGVLRNRGFDRDAAYNYEYIARLRDQAARAKPSTSKPDANTARAGAPARTRTGDLPAGPTIHGRPGTHPPATRGEEFEVITPMDFGDRETHPEPTPGVRMPKKG